MTSTPIKIVLASTSSRRKEILALLGLPFQTVPPRFEEVLKAGRPASEEARIFAEEKARSVEGDFPNSVVIGSDTLIECEGEKIGKPLDRADAARILRRLRNREHRIWTAVSLIDTRDRSAETAVESVRVRMNHISDAEIEAYASTSEPLDKAGAYSLQEKGRRFILRLEGDYLAAVGFPLRPIVDFLRRRGLSIPLDVDRLYREKNFLNWKSF